MNKKITLLFAGCLAVFGCSTHHSEINPTPNNSLLNSKDIFPGKIVLDLKDNISQSEIDELKKDYNFSNLEPTALFDSTKEEIADVDVDDEAAILDRLNHDARVEIAEPLSEVHADFTPNDPRVNEQWGMEKVGANTAWNYSTGRGVVVAVIDTGIACFDSPQLGFHKLSDLQDTECVPGFNFVANNGNASDDHMHGSHVAGTIAQSTNNGVGVAGLAFHAKLMPVKVLSATGSGTNEGVADGIRWAADHNANVINMSLGGGPNSAIMQKAIHYARSKGVVVVAAAGNSGGKTEYPGGSEGVIGVAALQPDDTLANFSCRGREVDIGAPGTNILQQTICEHGKNKCEEYLAINGTSMASPHVAGVAAMVVSLGITDPDAVEKVLLSTARQVPSNGEGKNAKFGAGVLDAASAVKSVVLKQILTRLGILIAFSLFVVFRSKKSFTSLLNYNFLGGAILSGLGLLCFLPFVLPRTELALELLSRPLGDFDLILSGQAMHQWLPFANFFLPLVLMTVFLNWEKGRNWVAGLSVGTVAYLLSGYGSRFSPFSGPVTTIWLALNVAVCGWVAIQCLSFKVNSQTPPNVNV